MKKMTIFSCIGAFALCTLFAFAADQKEDLTIFVIEGSKGAISERDDARINAGGIAGTSIEATIDGPAKMKRANIVTMNDGQILIGSTNVEFNIHPTGKGLVTVTVTSKSPTEPIPDVKTYKITVK